MMDTPRVAVIFRTHFWDDFCQRQFDRLKSVAEHTDVFIVVDETAGPIAGIGHKRTVRMTQDDVLGMGFAHAGEGTLLWFNGDYPLYLFADREPDYDFYVQLEYDVIVNQPIASIIEQVVLRGVDYVGLTKGEPASEWFWRDTMAGAYDAAESRHQLICFSVFSAPALRHLWQARLEQSAAYRAGTLTTWPFCEGFIPSELSRAGYVGCELSEFGDTEAYDHWPPYLERDAARLAEEDFLHPVLDEPRYIASLHKYHVGLGGYLNPNSQYHRKLRRLPPLTYADALARSFVGKVRRNLGRTIASLTARRIAVSEKG